MTRTRFSDAENAAIERARNRHPLTSQRGLAQKISGMLLDPDLNEQIVNAGLNNRSEASVYSAIRRLDKKRNAASQTEGSREGLRRTA